MVSYYIANEPGISWALFTDQCTGFSCENGMYIAKVLSAVRRVFLDTFGPETVNAHPLLSVVSCAEDPITYRRHALIFLSSTGNFYLQHIFQFAHELCHFMIPGDVCKEYRWFEETVCQAMSWYAIHQIYASRDVYPLDMLRNLYSTMEGYIKDAQSNRISLNGRKVSVFIDNNLAYLKKNCYNRQANNAIAYELYPLLIENPGIWKIVPFLDRLTPDMPLDHALDALSGLAGIAPNVRDLLTQRLCQQLAVPL